MGVKSPPNNVVFTGDVEADVGNFNVDGGDGDADRDVAVSPGRYFLSFSALSR